MATRITFTDDVGRIATASNADGSIRWHAYERPFGNGITIFVQREVNGVLEAEVRLLNEGERPEIFFDPATSRWLIFYVLNENAFLITADENDVPATQPPQLGTTADQFRPSTSDPNAQTYDQRLSNRVPLGGIAVGAYNGPPDVGAFGVGAFVPGTTFAVRWVPESSALTNLNLNIAGFRILRQDFGGPVVDVTPGGFIAFDGFRLYEESVAAVPGRYFVVQDNFRGDATTAIVEGLPLPPGDTMVSAGDTSDLAISRFEIRTGQGFRTAADTGLTFVDSAPVLIIEVDPIVVSAGQGLPESQDVTFNITTFGQTVPIIQTDTPIPSTGEGFFVSLTQTGFGNVVIG